VVAAVGLPPLEQFPDSIRPIAVEYAKLGEEYQATARRRPELEQERRNAELLDNQAYADALREGRRDPGPVNVRQVEAEQVAVRRRRDALALAIDSAYADLVAAIQRERAAWRKQLEGEFGDARAKYGEAVEALAATRRRDASRFPPGGTPSARPYLVTESGRSPRRAAGSPNGHRTTRRTTGSR